MRFMYVELAALCLFLCVAIVVFFGHNPFIRGSLGDVLIVMLIYFLLRAVCGLRPSWTAAIVFMVAILVEIGQHANLIETLGIPENSVTRIVFGSVFAVSDILAYAIGAITAFLLDANILTRTSKRRREWSVVRARTRSDTARGVDRR
jgi:hypothetical protein